MATSINPTTVFKVSHQKPFYCVTNANPTEPFFSPYNEWASAANQHLFSRFSSCLAFYIHVSSPQTWLIHGTQYICQSKQPNGAWDESVLTFTFFCALNYFNCEMYRQAWIMTYERGRTSCIDLKLCTLRHRHTHYFLSIFIVLHSIRVFMQQCWDSCGLLMFHHSILSQCAGTSPQGWSRY